MTTLQARELKLGEAVFEIQARTSSDRLLEQKFRRVRSCRRELVLSQPEGGAAKVIAPVRFASGRRRGANVGGGRAAGQKGEDRPRPFAALVLRRHRWRQACPARATANRDEVAKQDCLPVMRIDAQGLTEIGDPNSGNIAALQRIPGPGQQRSTAHGKCDDRS